MTSLDPYDLSVLVTSWSLWPLRLLKDLDDYFRILVT
jgi:hypothetical protein